MSTSPLDSDTPAVVAERALLFQLLARGFSHPDEPLHTAVTDGRFASDLTVLSGDEIKEVTAIPATFSAFESGYIRLFHTGGNSGSLSAGDHDSLLNGRSRPEFMLDYVNWYKHFGLWVHQGEAGSQQPDHLVCQLEFLAWLAHLEAQSAQGSDLLTGYRQAATDFVRLHLRPFLEVLQDRLVNNDEPCAPFYAGLCSLAAACAQTQGGWQI